MLQEQWDLFGINPPHGVSLVTAMGREQRNPSCSTSWASLEVWGGKWGGPDPTTPSLGPSVSQLQPSAPHGDEGEGWCSPLLNCEDLWHFEVNCHLI